MAVIVWPKRKSLIFVLFFYDIMIFINLFAEIVHKKAYLILKVLKSIIFKFKDFPFIKYEKIDKCIFSDNYFQWQLFS